MALSPVVVVVSLLLILAHSAAAAGRDLRPSDHGLTFQEDSFPPAQDGDENEMQSFFGASASAATVQLPEAANSNISDAVWSGGAAEGKAGDGRRDHVRTGLLVASAVCGLTGVVLLAVSGVVLVVRLHKRRAKENGMESTSAPNLEAVNEK